MTLRERKRRREMRAILYRLRKHWGVPADLYRIVPGELDINTGTTTDTKIKYSIPQFITWNVMEKYKLKSLSPTFDYGIVFEVGDRIGIIDGIYLPERFTLEDTDYIVYNNERYTLEKWDHLDAYSGFIIHMRRTQGIKPEQIIERTYIDRLIVTQDDPKSVSIIGPSNGAVFSEDNSNGGFGNWIMPSRVSISDDMHTMYATIGSFLSPYLTVLSVPDFSVIPDSANVSDIILRVEKHANKLDMSFDDEIVLVVDGTIQTDNQKLLTAWPLSDTVFIYHFYVTLTGAQIKAVNFGAAISVQHIDPTMAGITSSIDHVNFTAIYQ